MKIITDDYLHIPISLSIFVLSLCFPAIHYIEKIQEPGYYHSLALLILGWVGVIIGYDYSWLANISYLIGLIYFINAIKSCFFGTLTLVFALSFLTQEKIIDPFEWSLVAITKYGIGYYLWIISFFVFWLGQTWLAVYRLKNN